MKVGVGLYVSAILSAIAMIICAMAAAILATASVVGQISAEAQPTVSVVALFAAGLAIVAGLIRHNCLQIINDSFAPPPC